VKVASKTCKNTIVYVFSSTRTIPFMGRPTQNAKRGFGSFCNVIHLKTITGAASNESINRHHQNQS